MVHNFNFPILYQVKNSCLKNSKVFYVGDKKYIQSCGVSLPKDFKYNSIITVEKKLSIFLTDKDTKAKTIADALLKNLIDCTAITLHLGEINVNTKHLFASILLGLKNNWNLKSNKSKSLKYKIEVISDLDCDINSALALAKAQAFAQMLVNMPSNILTPTSYVELVKDFIKSEKISDIIKIKPYDESFIKSENMNSFLAVSKGSIEKPILLVLEYNLKKNNKPIVFVGKGLTFDSGGISIKPSLGMDAMKGDMAGSAAAISSVIYAALIGSPNSFVAICPCCENMPSHSSVKPGDVVIASNGLSIEVVDTDAEGRLVLADALHYSKKYKAKFTIDLATLTGACVVALGSIHSGLFTNDKKLKDAIFRASNSSNDLVWELPLVKEHEEFLDSKIADLSNLCLGKGAGASNGAVFLSKFAPKTGWAHLDIAGTATPKGVLASGRPVPLLSDLIDNS